MKRLFFLPVFLSIQLFCQDNIEQMRERFKQADRDFSKLSMEKGPLEAFSTFLTDDAYLLHAGSLPVTGKDKIREQYANFPKDAVLIWEPFEADCSVAGDLGYTVGRYQSKGKNPDGTPRIREGVYMTVWKKQPNGQLRAIADMGPPGAVPSDSVGRVVTRRLLRSETSTGGDFVISFGTYAVNSTDSAKRETKTFGKYISVWRRLSDGKQQTMKDVGSPSPSSEKN